MSRCEVCPKRATRSDSEGVPFCTDCYISLCHDTAREWKEKCAAAESRAAAIEREVARLRPVVEAAERASRMRLDGGTLKWNHDALDDLARSVRAYRAAAPSDGGGEGGEARP